MQRRLLFVSTVVIGRFNPGILTPEFLIKECGIDVGEGTFLTPKAFPVPRELEFKERGLSFFVDLDRFQIKETKINELNEIASPRYAGIYLEKLQYTPINACGINFNSLIRLQNDEKIKFNSLLNSENNLFEIFQVNDFEIETRRHYTKDTFAGNDLWILKFPLKEGLISSIRLALVKSDNVYELNHNIEVVGLEKNKENIRLIIENIDQNLTYHKDIVKKLLKEFNDDSDSNS